MSKTKSIRKKELKKNRKQQKHNQIHSQDNQLQQQVFQNSRKVFDQADYKVSSDQFKFNQITSIHKLIVNKWYKIHFSEPYQSLHSFCNGYLISNGKKCFNILDNQDRKTIIFKPSFTTQKERQSVKTVQDIENMLSPQIQPSFREWIHSFDPSNQILAICDKNIKLQFSQAQWKNLVPIHFFQPLKVLIVGHRNSGKSTLCHYLHNNNVKQTCIIDLDIGRSINAPGCVSLLCQDEKIGIWVGQLTPCYNIIGYMHAMYHLYSLYQYRFSNRGLIINTMGYLTGLGQALLYEAYNLIKPNKTILLQTDHTNKNLYDIKNKLATGSYVQYLYFSKNSQSVTSQHIHFVNKNSTSKFNCLKFIDVITSTPKNCLEQLLTAIQDNQLTCLNLQIPTYYQSKDGKRILINDKRLSINMQLLVLGKLNKDNTIAFACFGYGWNNKIYFDPSIAQQKIQLAIVNEGIDFDRSFYQMNEKKLIQLQLRLETQISYLEKVSTVLGSKGKRNLPSRKTLVLEQN